MESATNESAPSGNAGASSFSFSTSADGTKSVSHDWTTSSGSKVEQDTSSSSKKKSAHSSFVLGSPSDLVADEELHQSARAATVGVIVVLSLSMLMLLLHVGRRYLDATTTEVIFENYSIVVPETEVRTPVTWPTLKPTPFRPTATEGENSTMEEATESVPEDSPSNETEITASPTSEAFTADSSSLTSNMNSSTSESAMESITESIENSTATERTAESSSPKSILIARE